MQHTDWSDFQNIIEKQHVVACSATFSNQCEFESECECDLESLCFELFKAIIRFQSTVCCSCILLCSSMLMIRHIIYAIFVGVDFMVCGEGMVYGLELYIAVFAQCKT